MKTIFNIFFTYLLCFFIVSCGNNEESDNQNIQRVQNPDSIQNNIVLFIIPSYDMQIHSYLLKSNNSQGIRKFNRVSFYSPSSYFDSYSDRDANLTALMTGNTTLNGYLGIDKDSTLLQSWLKEYRNSHQIGLISNESLGSGFIRILFNGGINSSKFEAENTASNLIKFNPDFIWAPGKRYFDRRSDKKNLFEEMSVRKYDLNFNVNNLNISDSSNYAGIFNSYSIPDSVDIILNGLKVWNSYRAKKEKPFVLIVLLNDFNNSIDINGMEQKKIINQYFDRLIELNRKVEEFTFYSILNPFNTYKHELTFIENDSIIVRSSNLKFNNSHLPIWSFGRGSETFNGFFKNTDFYSRLSSIQKK